jgi:thymidylate synthase (FAD)
MEIKVLDKGFVKIIDTMGNDGSVAQAARVSYGDGTKTVHEDEGLIRDLLRHGHTTPFEMIQLKFHVRAPIFVLRQWHRHRMWSYNEMSGRYSEMPDDCFVPEENTVTTQNKNNKQGGTDDKVTNAFHYVDEFRREQEENKQKYYSKLNSGMRKELARINLPLSQYSEMYACVDLHNLFHFLKLRLDSHAQYEIRVYAEAIASLVKQFFPISYKAFEDYILHSVRLTKLEQEVLGKLISEPKSWALHNIAADMISNKREKTECIDKLLKITGII